MTQPTRHVYTHADARQQPSYTAGTHEAREDAMHRAGPGWALVPVGDEPLVAQGLGVAR